MFVGNSVLQFMSCSCQFPRGRPAVHSFPTRRSSDLYAIRGGMRSPVTGEPTHAVFGFTGMLLKLLTQYRDRKSTRLNSSHQIISYAVFCLKNNNSVWQVMSRALLIPLGHSSD